MRFEKSQRGYSVIELMIVLGAIGVLATIMVATISNAMERSRQKATMADMRTISKALEAYSADNQRVPDDLGGMPALEQAMRSYTNNGAFPMRDKWGNFFRYVRSGESYMLESFGKDGLNGEDYATDGTKDFTQDLVMVNGIFVAAPD